jgi:hypothetical protein
VRLILAFARVNVNGAGMAAPRGASAAFPRNRRRILDEIPDGIIAVRYSVVYPELRPASGCGTGCLPAPDARQHPIL